MDMYYVLCSLSKGYFVLQTKYSICVDCLLGAYEKKEAAALWIVACQRMNDSVFQDLKHLMTFMIWESQLTLHDCYFEYISLFSKYGRNKGEGVLPSWVKLFS